MKNIFLIDDDPDFVKWVRKALKGRMCVTAGYGKEDFYRLFTPYKYDLVLLDLRLKKNKEGLDLLRYIKEEDPLVPVIVITAYASIDTAVEALQNGAITYIEKKKISERELLLLVERLIEEKRAKERIEALLREKERLAIVGESPKIKRALQLAKTAAEDGESTVLIRGETGTGKELIARFIHETGKRREGPFVSVAISALNRETLSSELFGHEKGAFTGAYQKHTGYFEQAHRGVLFLDEIGELDLNVQKMLLRVLETHTLRRLGGTKDIKLDFQLVTATNAPLEEMVDKGLFRRDLYYRLKVVEIVLPPLRERKEDIKLLADYFLKALKKKGRTEAEEFSDEVIRIFLDYPWPGNVRELKHVVEFAALRAKLTQSPKIFKSHLPENLQNESPLPSSETPLNIQKILAEMELSYIEKALKKTSWKKKEAWKLLGYSSRFAMTRRIKKWFKKFPELEQKYSFLLNK